jgi:hypothetical protein
MRELPMSNLVERTRTPEREKSCLALPFASHELWNLKEKQAPLQRAVFDERRG